MSDYDAIRAQQFLDRFGNMKPNSYQEQSENPSLFNTVYYFSHVIKNTPQFFAVMHDVQQKHKAKYISNDKEWRTMEYDHNPSWSHDEKIAVLAFYNETGNLAMINTIPLLGHPSGNSSFWSYFRPDVFAFTVITKWNSHWTRLALRWIIDLKIEKSLKDFARDPQGESSGVQKAFVMLMGLKDFDRVRELEGTIKEAINIYYPEEDHPIRRVWNEQ